MGAPGWPELALKVASTYRIKNYQYGISVGGTLRRARKSFAMMLTMAGYRGAGCVAFQQTSHRQ